MILEEYNKWLQANKGNFKNVQVFINEEDNYGKGIVSYKDDTFINVWYNADSKQWC